IDAVPAAAAGEGTARETMALVRRNATTSRREARMPDIRRPPFLSHPRPAASRVTGRVGRIFSYASRGRTVSYAYFPGGEGFPGGFGSCLWPVRLRISSHVSSGVLPSV